MTCRYQNLYRCFPAMVLAPLLAITSPSLAEETKLITIQAKRTDQALLDLAEQSGTQVVFSPEIATGSMSAAVSGAGSVADALNILLSGTGLAYEFTASNVVVVTKKTNAGHAGESDTKQVFVLEEIVVTAQRREQLLKDVPISIAAIGSEALKAQRISGLEDIGLAVPGVAVADQGTGYRRVNMRGIGNVSGSSPLVGIYLDEVSVTGFSSFIPDLQVFDLERVEVLKGPQGTLYGQGSVGGTIRYITKKPVLDAFEGAIGVSASFTQDGSPSQKIEGMVNVPLVEDEFALRITGVFENSGGWIDQPDVSQKNINHEDIADVRIKGLWHPSDPLEVSVMANIHRNDAGAPNTAEGPNGDFIQAFGYQTTPSSEDDFDILNLTVNYDFGAASLLSSSSYFKSYNLQDNRGGSLPVSPAPEPELYYLINPTEGRTEFFNEEVRFTTSGDGPFQASVGGVYQDLTHNNAGLQYLGLFDDPSPIGIVYDANYKLKSWAIFGESSLEITDWLEAGAGLRYFEDDRQQTDHVAQTVQRDVFTSLSPRFYVSVKASDSLNFYASVAKGFRSGGFNVRGRPPYNPESVWTYEAGTKFTAMDSRLSGEFSFFYSKYRGFQINGLTVIDGLPLASISNAGSAEIKGVDGRLSWQIDEQHSIEIGGNYVDTEVVAINALSASHQVGDPLDLVSNYQFYVSFVREYELLARPGSLRVDYSQQGPSYWRLRNIGPHFVAKSDTINMLNFNATWDCSETVSLGFFGKNLLNDRGYLDAFRINGDGARARPRTFGVQANVRF